MITTKWIQYMLPDGHQKHIERDVADDLQPQLDAIAEAGCRLECEVSITGEVSFTIFDPESEEDVCIELVENGPKVPAAVDKLIRGFSVEAMRKLIE